MLSLLTRRKEYRKCSVTGSAGLLKNARRFEGEARSFKYCHFADVAIDDEMKL